jgi:hypothetical protein
MRETHLHDLANERVFERMCLRFSSHTPRGSVFGPRKDHPERSDRGSRNRELAKEYSMIPNMTNKTTAVQHLL